MLNHRLLYNVHIHHKPLTIYYSDVSEHFSNPIIFHTENLKGGVTSKRRKIYLSMHCVKYKNPYWTYITVPEK
jgi:hypothetical protein